MREGDTLLPTLFATFIEDFVRCLNSFNKGVQSRDKSLANLLFADELVIIASNKEYFLRESGQAPFLMADPAIYIHWV